MLEHAKHPVPPQRYNELALQAMGVGCEQTRPEAAGGVVIGFVDYGFDLLHPCLMDASGTTSRFKYLWDQNRAPELVRQWGPIAAVEDYPAAVINRLIDTARRAVVAPLNDTQFDRVEFDRTVIDAVYDPHAHYYGRAGVCDGAHGTQMASIAAGTAFNGFRSPAPFADLIGVQLAVADTDWREETASGEPAWRDWVPASDQLWAGWRTYDACPQIVHAIQYIYDRASRLGAELVIINLSIGTWAGAHDGQSPVEQAIAQVIADGRRPDATACQVVVGAGNSGADQGHFMSTIRPGTTTSFQWVMTCKDITQNKLEIWYTGAPLEISLSAPSGDVGAVLIIPGTTHSINFSGTRVGIADHVIAARGPLSRVRVLLHPPYMTATNTDVLNWTLTVTNPAAATTAEQGNTLHAWVERDDGIIERSWLVPHHRDSTLCCLATAPDAIVVGGAHQHNADAPLTALPFSGRGPSPWTSTARAEKPDTMPIFSSAQHLVLAPAYNIWGAASKSLGFTATSGTSAAAALMSGALAAQRVAASTSRSHAVSAAYLPY